MPKTGLYRAVIVIKDMRSKPQSPVANSKASESKSSGSAAGKAENLAEGVSGLASYKMVASTADKLITYELSQVELRTGAREKEQQMQAVYNAGKNIVNKGVALGIGIATGNLPLVVLGLVTSTIGTVINIAQKQNTIDTQQRLENISIQMQNERAGVQGRRGTTQ